MSPEQVKALAAKYNLESQIQDLINSGVSPEDALELFDIL